MNELREYAARQIGHLEKIINTSGGRARLANLRRGVGKVPGELPELWGEFLNGIPECLLSRNGEVTRGEWAIYLSLTMYAFHQQGNSESVNKAGESLGKAASQLMKDNSDEERERVLRRFGPIITAKDMPELAHHLRCLIQLMSANKKIKLDYVNLAEDIYKFQSDDLRKKVQLKWGQDFYKEKGEE